jgi:hypothetical protein
MDFSTFQPAAANLGRIYYVGDVECVYLGEYAGIWTFRAVEEGQSLTQVLKGDSENYPTLSDKPSKTVTLRNDH